MTLPAGLGDKRRDAPALVRLHVCFEVGDEFASLVQQRADHVRTFLHSHDKVVFAPPCGIQQALGDLLWLRQMLLQVGALRPIHVVEVASSEGSCSLLLRWRWLVGDVA